MIKYEMYYILLLELRKGEGGGYLLSHGRP